MTRASRSANKSVRGEVFSKAGNGRHTFTEGLKSGELLVNTVIFTEGPQAFDGFEELEVDHAGPISNKPLFITKISDDLRHLLEGLSKHILLAIFFEGYVKNEVHHMVGHKAIEHQNMSSLLRIGTEELRGPFLANVEGDSL